MAKAKQYQFKTQPVTVVTPVARTLFMCLAEENEYTGNYGGKLLFDEDSLNKEVNWKSKTDKGTAPFKDVVNDLIDAAVAEYKATGKKATKAEKIQVNTDQDGNETDDFELSCKNQDQPRIVNRDKTVEKDYDTLVGNGSTVKAQLYLKPYVMQGKVGVPAYLNSVQLLDIIEYGGGDDMFDDETDGDNDDLPFDDDDNDGDY